MTKVLIADDEVEVRSVIKVILSGKSHEVVEATDGEDTLKVAAKETPGATTVELAKPYVWSLN